MTATAFGVVGWDMQRDEDGHRDYTIRHRVVTTTKDDGPATVLVATGLPAIGAYWDYGNDLDGWAWCLPTREVEFYGRNEERGGIFWTVTSHFSTKRDSKRCQDASIEDPLLEPDRLSGSFVKYTREVLKNYDGSLIRSSSHEVFRGPQVEFDANRPTVTIEQNVADLDLDVFAQMVDTVNDATLWGLASRKVKLSNVSWSRQIYGTCNYYFTRTLEFDVDFKGFDREILDEGTKVLNGHWEYETVPAGTGSGLGTWVLDDIAGSPPDPSNPQHFIRYKDRNGENSRVVLNGAGLPLEDGDSPYYHTVQYYSESNFLLLGVPATLV